MASHFFDPEIASAIGLEPAIILQNLNYWIEKNIANEKHFHDGAYWTYNSVKAFSTIFPYMSDNTIRKALKTLEDYGIIKSGNYNKMKFDRTLWYSITENGFAILKDPFTNLCKIHLLKTTNGSVQNNEPIPVIITDRNSIVLPNRNVPFDEKNGNDEKPSQENKDLPFDDDNDKDIDSDKKELPEESIRLASLLYSLHRLIDNKYKVSDKRLNGWAVHIERIHRLDGRDWDEIEKVIRWAKGHNFWRSNIMSADSLRDKFPKLVAQMTTGGSRPQSSPQAARRTEMCEIPEV